MNALRVGHPQSMDKAQQLRLADRILQELLDAPVEARPELLARRCTGDDELHGLVAALLAEARGIDEGDDETLRLDLDVRELIDDPRQFIGAQVGNFRLERLLGTGGMGMVFEAARTAGGFEQVAAVKLLTRYGEMLAPDARQRFNTERQTLARLDHPGIARLIDGGVYRDRVPYLVMEYVRGTNLVRYCLERDAGMERRLELFEAVAAAVRHAHRQMVVHRDIKPGNIMVDTEGRIRLLDFGIAGATHEGTEVGAAYSRWFSIGYASPEVLAGEPATAASDIYQLGVVLFELLTGQRPYADNVARSSQRPAPPAAGAVAQANGRPWHRRLRGDLDAIIDGMLERAPARRYDDIDRVLEDVSAWRQRRPISLRAHRPGYRFGRLLARRWLPLTAGLVLGGVLVAYAATVTWQRDTIREQTRQVELEARNAEQILDFTRRMIGQANPARTPDLSVTELLLRGVEMAESEFQGKPEVRIQILINLARGLQDTGASRQAERLLTQVFTDMSGLTGGLKDSTRIRAHMLDAQVRLNLGQWEAAQKSLEAAHGLIEAQPEPVPHLEAEYLNHLTSWQMGTGRLQAARDTQQRLMALGQNHDLPHEMEVYALSYRSSLAADPAVSIALQREVLERERTEYGDQHPLTVQAAMDLATILGMTGRFEEALELWHYGLPLQERFYGDDHFRRVQMLTNYAYILIMHGKLRKATEIMSEASDILSERGESVSIRTMTVATGLGWLEALNGNFDTGEALLTGPVETMLARLGGDHHICLQPVTALAGIHLYKGNPERAQQLLDTCDRDAVRDHASAPMVLFMTESLQARLLLADDEPRAAYHLADRLLGQIRGREIDRLWPGFDLRVTKGHAARRLGRDAESRELLEQAEAGLARTLGSGHWLTERARLVSRDRLATGDPVPITSPVTDSRATTPQAGREPGPSPSSPDG